MRGVISMSKIMGFRWISNSVAVSVGVTFFLSSLLFGAVAFAEENNRLLSVAMDTEASAPTVLIKTKSPVGYRYTIYDSEDPNRVIIDFPAMDITSEQKDLLSIQQGAVQELRIAKFELASGDLARVEILLAQGAEYQVKLDGAEFRVAFADDSVAVSAAPENPKSEVVTETKSLLPVNTDSSTSPATMLEQIVFAPGQAQLQGNGEVGKHRYFAMSDPPRLVVDLYDITPGFDGRVLKANGSFSKVRVGTHPDKTRLVFDAATASMPEYEIVKRATDYLVLWGDSLGLAANVTKPMASKVVANSSTEVAMDEAVEKKTVVANSNGPVSVQSLDFENSEEQSQIIVGLSNAAEVVAPTEQEGVVHFDIKQATLDQALRHSIDTSAFPSAVSTVTPYEVKTKYGTDVRVAVQLKGDATYVLEQDENLVKLVVDNGEYAVAMPAASENQELDVAESEDDFITDEDELVDADEGFVTEEDDFSDDDIDEDDEMDWGEEEDEDTASTMKAKAEKYTGEKISLVFDSADVRSILQLIGDVSGLNILASGDVGGNVTLRLTDVPWDQALELVLETAGLGKRQEGNVLRILPIEKMRDEEQAKIEAEQMRVDQGVLESRVYPISYASVEDMEGYLDNLKSDRGSIVADSRNKQLIVRDVAPVHDQMAEMVAHIDKPERQVMIEARIVEANTNFSKDLGVQWNFDYQDSDIGRGEVPNQNWNMLTNSTGMGGSFWIPVTDPASAGFATEMIFGALDGNLDIGLRLSALESSGDVRVISTPRVTTLNGQSASISQGTKIPYATVGDAGTNIEFEDAELKLEVTPEINPDGSIILDISASSSAIGSAVPVAGGLAMSIDAKDAQTKVLVRDGQTTVIGGVFIEDERDSNTGVPILKDIPIIGDLFKSTSKASSRKELLIFITPRIVET